MYKELFQIENNNYQFLYRLTFSPLKPSYDGHSSGNFQKFAVLELCARCRYQSVADLEKWKGGKRGKFGATPTSGKGSVTSGHMCYCAISC